PPATNGPPMAHADIAGDARLTAPVRLKDGTVRDALVEIGKTLPLCLVASTALESRPLGMHGEQIPARDVFEAVRRATGAAWGMMGATYVLQGDRKVERLAQLKEEERAAWIRSSVRDAYQGLTREQRLTLRETGALPAEQLTPRQRDMLGWAAAAAFVMGAVPVEGLRLEGASLAYASEKTPRGPVPQIAYRSPAPDGGAATIAKVRLR
ncbi:MAG TPA: hypothetical protein VK689_00095, partial [Armatimonadota bacterium]|nr:hypothetical protein [Armatimonadota bacterium]